MSGKRFLLDTNIVIALFANEVSIIKSIDKAEEIFVPAIVFGELLYGAELSSRKEQNIKKLKEFSLICTIIDCNFETAIEYASIKGFLKRKGMPIPENDIWIAAISMQYQFSLATRDKHFDSIKNLKIVNW